MFSGSGRRWAHATLIAGALVLAGVAEAPTQDLWTVDAGGGIVIPVGDLADYHDLGASLEAAAGYRLHPRVHARLFVAHQRLAGADWDNVEPVSWEGVKPQGPGGTFTYFLLGPAVPVTIPERDGWRIFAYAGGGAARVDLEPTAQSNGGVFVRPAAGGGAELVYPLGAGVSLMGRSVGLLFLRPFGGGLTGDGYGYGKELAFSYSAGLRFAF